MLLINKQILLKYKKSNPQLNNIIAIIILPNQKYIILTNTIIMQQQSQIYLSKQLLINPIIASITHNTNHIQHNDYSQNPQQILENHKLKNRLQEFREKIERMKEQIAGYQLRRFELEGNNKVLMEQFIKAKIYIESKEIRVGQLQLQIEHLTKQIKSKQYVIREKEDKANKLKIQSLGKDVKLKQMKQEWQKKLQKEIQSNREKLKKSEQSWQNIIRSQSEKHLLDYENMEKRWDQKFQKESQDKQNQIQKFFTKKLQDQANEYKIKEQDLISRMQERLDQQNTIYKNQERRMREEFQTVLLRQIKQDDQQKRILELFWSEKLTNLTSENNNQKKSIEQSWMNRISKMQENFSLKFNQLEREWKHQLEVELITHNQLVSKYTQIIIKNEEQIHKKQNQLIQLFDNHDKLLNQVLTLRKDKEIKKQQFEKLQKTILQYQKYNQDLQKQVRSLQIKLQEKDLIAQQQRIDKIRDIQVLQSQYHEKLLCKDREIEALHFDFNQKSEAIVKKYVQLIKNITKDFRQELSQLKFMFIQKIEQLKDELLHILILYGEETSLYCAPGRSRITMNQSSMSVLNREQMLEFQIEQLKKELIQMKSENYSLKFENKKYENKIIKQKIMTGRCVSNISDKLSIHDNSIKKPEVHIVSCKNKTPILEMENRTSFPEVRNEKEFKKKRREVQDHKAADQKLLSEILEMRQRVKECQLRSKRE